MSRNQQGRNAPLSRSAKRRRLAVLLLGVAVISASAVGIVERERRIEAHYLALPPAQEGELEALEDRVAGLDRLIERHPLSRQTFHMARERHRLRLELDALEADRDLADRREEEERTARVLHAESERMRGLWKADAEDLEAAYEHFNDSLENSPMTWEQAERVRKDMDAIGSFLEEKR